jgi:hypothetical protein
MESHAFFLKTIDEMEKAIESKDESKLISQLILGMIYQD